MSYSYHWVEIDKLPSVVAYLVGYKGHKLSEIYIGDRTSHGKKNIRVSPALRASTLSEGMTRIQNWLNQLGLEATKSVDSLGYEDIQVKIDKLWVCRCVEEDGYYKIRKRGVVDKCFICEETSTTTASPDIEKGTAYLKEQERKEIAFKRGVSPITGTRP